MTRELLTNWKRNLRSKRYSEFGLISTKFKKFASMAVDIKLKNLNNSYTVDSTL